MARLHPDKLANIRRAVGVEEKRLPPDDNVNLVERMAKHMVPVRRSYSLRGPRG